MNLRPGQKLRSAVSDAEVVVVRAAEGDVVIACGGVPMRSGDDEPTVDAASEGQGPEGEGLLLGKRYVDDELGIEMLCTRPGDGALSVDGRVMTVKGAKPLPSSD